MQHTDAGDDSTDALTMDAYIIAGSHATLAVLGIATMVALAMGA